MALATGLRGRELKKGYPVRYFRVNLNPMQGLQKVGFLALVCFFGSASVFVAGSDMHRRLSRYTDEEKQSAHELIEQLRGETLVPGKAGGFHVANIPSRATGSALSASDKSKIGKFLRKLFASEPEQSEQEPPAKQDEAAHFLSEVAANESSE